MNRTLSSLAPLSLLVLLLAGCGGGSGDSAPPPSPPLPQLALDPSQVQTYFGTTFSLSDVTRFFSEIGLSAYGTFARSGGIEPVTVGCENGGTITISLDDKDHSAGLSVHDRITVTYTGCKGGSSDTLDAVLQVDINSIHSGSSSVSIERAPAAANSNSLGYSIGIDSFTSTLNGQTVELSGALDVEYLYSANEDHFHVTLQSLTDQGTYPQGTQTLTLRDYTQDLAWNYDTLRYTLSIAGRIDVQAGTVQGYFTFDTGTELGGIQHNYPTSGKLTLHGASGGYMRLEEGTDSSNSQDSYTNIYIAATSGAVESQTTAAWSNFINVDSVAPLRSGVDLPVDTSQPAPPQSLAARVVDLGADAADMALDPARSSLYVSVPQRNEIVVISTANYQVTERIPIGQRPSGIDLSQDGVTLYIANKANGTVSALNLNTRTVATIDVAAALGTGQVFDVVEGAPGILYVAGASADANNHQLLRIDHNAGDAIQPLGDAGGNYSEVRLAMDPARRYLYVTRTDGSLFRIDTSDPQLPMAGNFLGGSYSAVVPEFFPDGSRLIASGTVLDASTLQPDAAMSPIGGIAARVTSDGTHLLNTYDGLQYDVRNLEADVEVGSYAVNCPAGGQFHAFSLLDQANSWAILYGSNLCVVARDHPQDAPGVASDPAPQPPTVDAVTTTIQLNGSPYDIALDDTSGLAYISMTIGKEVLVVDTVAQTVATHIPLASGPRALALSADRATLYVSVDSPIGIAYIDTATRTVTRIVDLPGQFQVNGNMNITEAVPGRLFIANSSASPSVIQLHLDPSDTVDAVAGGTLSSVVSLGLSPDRTVLYVGDNWPLGTIHRLDLTQPQAPLLPPTDSYRVPFNGYLNVSPDGTRIYLNNGKVVDSLNSRQLGQVGAADALQIPFAQHTRNLVTAAQITYSPTSYQSAQLTEYDPATLLPVRVLNTGCQSANIVAFRPASNETRWLLLSDNMLCVVTPP